MAFEFFTDDYFDDLIGSARDVEELRGTYNGILAACVQANLIANPDKLIPPADAIVAFNCNLTHGHASVTDDRIKRFIDEERGPVAESAFLAYCDRVGRCNHAA
jgi:hypothetical protein